ncbi:conjugative transposon protein TraN [Flavobacterium johnsoniae]|uniref:Conjugative transposon protein TraN n=1 Tax=Flavobacterium johnsoniae TaxID=986 RepID=A0A1J7C3Q4_FLAJO|nr:conjugative transposon protein TraN [Flavobacterium johnsoniae]OIV40329.1 conjugative transposon protein TraN [Flavobacterium johnsoniae]
MKNNKWILVCCFLITAGLCPAQISKKSVVLAPGEFKNLHIAYSKTTSIVFPYAIKSLDKGSEEVLVQKARAVENVLLLKAAKHHFAQTNLTVVTAEGRLYVFVLNYEEACPDLNLQADNSAAVHTEILFSLDNENQKKIQQYARLALSKKTKAKGPRSRRFEIKLTAGGLFIHQDIWYLRLAVDNASKINYDIDQLRFFIRDQRKAKRTASQEIELTPLYSTCDTAVIPDKSEVTAVYALSKFTIPEKKCLTIQLIEKNGGRQIEIDVKNSDLLNADVLSSL